MNPRSNPASQQPAPAAALQKLSVATFEHANLGAVKTDLEAFFMTPGQKLIIKIDTFFNQGRYETILLYQFSL